MSPVLFIARTRRSHLWLCWLVAPGVVGAQSTTHPAPLRGLPIPVGPANPGAVADSLAQGRRDLAVQRWLPAARKLRWALDRAPLSGEDWRSLMLATYGARDWRGARQAAEYAYRLGTKDQREVALYAAASHGQLGSLDSGFAWLRRALVDQHFEFRGTLDDDADFAPLKRDPRWAALVRPPTPATEFL